MNNQIKQLHERILIIMDEIHHICVENNIKYSLAGGSLIGAMRHKGFIPWDDDLDIMMPYDDFQRFIDIVFSMQHDWLEFNMIGKTPGCYRPLIKAYDNRTTLIQSNNDIPKGVFVDIFPFVYVGNTIMKAKLEYFLYRVTLAPLVRKANVYRDKNIVKEFLLTTIGKIFPASFWYYFIKAQYERLRDTPTKFVADLDGTTRGIVLAEYTEAYKLTDFEDRHYYRFCRTHEYLKSVWGDYMKLPPIEKQKPTHIAYLNINLPYREYHVM